MKPTPDQLSKLPKWVQEYIADLKRERDESLRSLNKWVDDQTPSPVSIPEYLCTGERSGPTEKVRYIQTDEVVFRHAGIELQVRLVGKEVGHGHGHDDCIRLQWSDPKRLCNRVAFVPTSFQAAEIITKDNIR